MQIVIDVDEELYNHIKSYIVKSGMRTGKSFMAVTYNAIANGTPLPKGHGDLIDRDEIAFLTAMHKAKCGYISWSDAIRRIKYSAPTIVEATKEDFLNGKIK